MKILKAKIDWYLDYCNAPELQVWADEIPYDQVRYDQRGSCYWGEVDGYVSFYSYSSPGEGFGGREFTLNMTDGTTKVLKGPWSGNEHSMAAAGFPMSYAVSIIVPDPRGGETHYGGHLTEARYLEAFEFCKDEAHLIALEQPAPYSETCDTVQNMVIGFAAGANTKKIRSYVIARKGMTFAQSQAHKEAVRTLARYQKEENWIPWIMWDAEKDRTEKKRERDRTAAYFNELISTHRLEAFGLSPITTLLPVPDSRERPQLEYSWSDEGDGGDV